MKWSLLLVVLMFGASCGSPEPTDAWAVREAERTEDVEEPTDDVCDDIRTFALGSHGDDTNLDNTLEELARLAAVTGATAALPLLNDIAALAEDTTMSDHRRGVEQHDLMVSAGQAIDDATSTACGLPGFSALYAASGFPDCHFEMEIPIAAYTTSGTPGQCTTEGRPDFLPCWSADGDHLAVDCVTNEIVTAVGDRWDPAGPPRVFEIDRTDPDEEPGPAVIMVGNAPECAGLAALFGTDAALVSDFDRLTDATASLDSDIRAQIADFLRATVDPPSLDEFEAMVAALDASTAEACGLPLVSAWVSLSSAVDTLPCWISTGERYPAYEQTACP